MKTGVIQMPVCGTRAVNLKTAEECVAEAAEKGAQIAVLPEMFSCLYTNESFVSNAEPAGGETWTRLSRVAAEHGIWLIGGSFPEQDGRHIYNTSFVFDRTGTQRTRHRKAHLFDIDVPGGQYFRESDTFRRGEQVTVFRTEFGTFGLCICFDMRFPLLSLAMARQGAQVIFAPAAFNMTTGPAHWETMFRSRAVDNQVFTVGAAPARDESGPYVSYGHSIVCDPWGTVLYQAGAEPAVHVIDLDLSRTDEIRRQLPLLSGERESLYQGYPFFTQDG